MSKKCAKNFSSVPDCPLKNIYFGSAAYLKGKNAQNSPKLHLLTTGIETFVLRKAPMKFLSA